MKKTIVLMSFLLIILTLSVLAQDIDAPGINISFMNQDPDPVGPGEYFEVRFKIHNTMPGTVAEDFQLMLEPEYPFSLDPNENPLRNIGDLPALGPGDNVIVVKYKVRVADNAVEGVNPLRLKFRHENLGWFGIEYPISIQTVDANLAISAVVTEPEMIKPGEKVLLKIKLKNMADSTMRDVSLKLDLTFSQFLSQVATITASDSVTAFNSLPFAPLGSATEQKIYSLAPGEIHEFYYNLITYSDAESKVYKVPVVITYYDELETQYVKNDIIGLIVGAKPDMSVIIEDSELYVGKNTGAVSIKFINKGFSDVKFLDVKLGETEEFELLSASEVYVGNVDSDDYETADFSIYLKNGASSKEKTIDIPLTVEYRDANNNVYVEEISLGLKVLSAKKLGMQQSSGAGFFIVLIIIGGVIFYFYRRRRKKKK